MVLPKKPESDDEINIEIDGDEGVGRLPQSVSINNVPKPQLNPSGASRRKKEGIDLHKAFNKQDEENNRSGSDKLARRPSEV